MLELEERYPTVFETTWASPFRSDTDYEINSWLHHYYGYLVGRAVVGSIRYDYFDLSHGDAWRRMRRLLRSRDMDTFCINDSALVTDEMWSGVEHWMASYFEQPASWERQAEPEAGSEPGSTTGFSKALGSGK